MKTLSCALTALWLCSLAPTVGAQGATEEKKTEEKKADEGATAADPWSLPKQDEAAAESTEPAATTPQVVSPSAYPTAEIDRPFALPQRTLEPRLGFGVDFMSGRYGDNHFGMDLGAGFGIIDKLEVGLDFPFLLAPEVRAGDMQLYGLYDIGPFLDNKLHVAGRGNVFIGLSDYYNPWMSDFVLLADAPIKFKVHDIIAITGDLGLGLSMGNHNSNFLLFIDFGVLLQPMEPLAVSLDFGFHNFSGDMDITWIPMNFKAQYTLMGDLDVWAQFGFPDLHCAGADHVQLLFGAAYRFGM